MASVITVTNSALAASANAASRRHEALKGFKCVQVVGSPDVLIETPAGRIRANGHAVLQILRASGEDALDWDSLAAELDVG